MKARVRTIAPTRAGSAASPPENRKRKKTGRNEMRERTRRSMGSRRSGRESKSPMYHAWRRRLFFNGSPHDLDEGLIERRRLERHAASVIETPLHDLQDLRVRPGLEHLPSVVVRPRRFDDHLHPCPGLGLRFVDRSYKREVP